MFASHATNQKCLEVFACFTTASSKASFLGVQNSECQVVCGVVWCGVVVGGGGGGGGGEGGRGGGGVGLVWWCGGVV